MKTRAEILDFLADTADLRDARVEKVVSGLEGADKQIAANYAAVGWNYAIVAVLNFLSEGDGDER